ncbi:MAG: efflux transporter outer membrane subunit [Herbaspirillum huttiense]|uniref:efflux transporter outer membrane subunit n=1 Tax=Herbaspirillum huttiense TaxID=863372 RepID=UPI001ACBF8A3|nr:efflux transporter outer membrane subunit [Herbaspirillum huttiense]MBN9358875.1 efflux transporter outer membrane subunit [Herbaspirillum huttiense]
MNTPSRSAQIISLVTLAVVLAACAGPRPGQPEQAAVTLPAQWRDPLASTQGISLSRWWEAFGDPVLNQLVDQVLAGNSDLAMAAARVQQARASSRLATAQRMPSLSASGMGAHQGDVDAFGRARVQDAWQGELSLSYELDLFGRLADLDAAARASLLATDAARSTLRLALIATTTSTYIGLRAQQARLEVLDQTLEMRAQSLQLARRRAQQGYASRLEVEQSQSEYAATEQLIASTRMSISRNEHALALLAGQPALLVAPGAGLQALTLPAIRPDQPAALLRQRPDIFQAEQQLVAADHTLDAARAALMPSLRIGLSGGVVGSNLLPDPLSIFSAGGSILAPLLDGGRLRAQADATAARRDEAAYAYQKAVLVAWRDVEDALAAARGAQAQQQAVQEQEVALREALAMSRKRYRAGYSPYLEQLDAQRGLLSAQLLEVQARADRLSAMVSLAQALGGGWEAERGQDRSPQASSSLAHP